MDFKTNHPLVSVVIPCYNVSAYVEKAVTSILQQTFTNLEIWIIDDASTDDTLQKIQTFRDQRIKIAAYKDNTQKVGAVNDVLKKVTGDYIAFQDADDWSEPGRIKAQIEQFAADKELGICFTRFRYTGYKKSTPGKIALTNDELRNEFVHFYKKKDDGISPPMCPTMMISREALAKTHGYHPYFSGRVAEDIQWVYRILKYFKGITVNQVLYNYSLRQGSFTQKQFDGSNAKYAYSWQLLSSIIYQDICKGVDVLDNNYADLLKKLELEACEQALTEHIQLLNDTLSAYRNSASFKIGNFILSPVRFLKKLKRTAH